MKCAAVLILAAGAAFCAAPEEFSTAAGTLAITPIEHASLILRAGGKVLYVDPAQGSYEGLPKADYILLTDIHGDHLAPAVIARLKTPSTVILGPRAVAAQVGGVTVISNGERKTLGDFQVEAVAMYNLQRGPAAGQLYHEKGRGNGYVVTYGGKRFYFSGDTEAIPEMKALRQIDVAFVCMNLPYTMTPQEAADGVRAFHPSIVYPYHYRGADLQAFAKALEGTGIDVRLREWYPR